MTCSALPEDYAARALSLCIMQPTVSGGDAGIFRRLHTLLEKLLEDVSFEAPEITDKHVVIDENYVDTKLADIVVNRDLTQFIL